MWAPMVRSTPRSSARRGIDRRASTPIGDQGRELRAARRSRTYSFTRPQETANSENRLSLVAPDLLPMRSMIKGRAAVATAMSTRPSGALALLPNNKPRALLVRAGELPSSFFTERNGRHACSMSPKASPASARRNSGSRTRASCTLRPACTRSRSRRRRSFSARTSTRVLNGLVGGMHGVDHGQRHLVPKDRAPHQVKDPAQGKEEPTGGQEPQGVVPQQVSEPKGERDEPEHEHRGHDQAQYHARQQHARDPAHPLAHFEPPDD